MKDNFSSQSEQYFKFRPTYPDELYSFLLKEVHSTQKAWDCGTGNGQVALILSNNFIEVYATDISENQILNAPKKDNVFYKVESAEQTSFQDNSFDLITIAQAIHWFNFDKFYKEVNRTIKKEGIIAVIGYGLIQIDTETDKIIEHFYHSIVGPYWDKERKYIDENYQTIPFPFKEIAVPKLSVEFQWTLEQLIGYLGTWSSVQHYINNNKQNPVDLIYKELKSTWGKDSYKTIKFPILLRVGKPL